MLAVFRAAMLMTSHFFSDHVTSLFLDHVLTIEPPPNEISNGSFTTLTSDFDTCSKGPITWRVSAQAEISARPPGRNFVVITWLVSARAEI